MITPQDVERVIDYAMLQEGLNVFAGLVPQNEYGRRMEGAELFGLTTPLLTTASGAKMGKTASGAVWLNEESLPAYDFWQYWRNSDDRDVGRFLKLFTDLPLDEIARPDALEHGEHLVAVVDLAVQHQRRVLDQAIAGRAVKGGDARIGQNHRQHRA